MQQILDTLSDIAWMIFISGWLVGFGMFLTFPYFFPEQFMTFIATLHALMALI